MHEPILCRTEDNKGSKVDRSMNTRPVPASGLYPYTCKCMADQAYMLLCMAKGIEGFENTGSEYRETI